MTSSYVIRTDEPMLFVEWRKILQEIKPFGYVKKNRIIANLTFFFFPLGPFWGEDNIP